MLIINHLGAELIKTEICSELEGSLPPAKTPAPLREGTQSCIPGRGAWTRDAASGEKAGKIPGEGWAGKAGGAEQGKRGYGHLQDGEGGEIRKELAR